MQVHFPVTGVSGIDLYAWDDATLQYRFVAPSQVRAYYGAVSRREDSQRNVSTTLVLIMSRDPFISDSVWQPALDGPDDPAKCQRDSDRRESACLAAPVCSCSHAHN